LRVAVVLAGYGVYALVIAATPADAGMAADPHLQRGRSVWLNHNCGSCHGLVGLGGHLGPDLTRLDERLPRKTLAVLLASSPAGMPSVELPPSDLDAMVDWLAAVRQTAAWPPRSLSDSALGAAP